jgi:hemoglobin-like flavoprotein
MNQTPHQTAQASLLEASLEAVAASGVDIVPEFFNRFFAAWPHQQDSFNRPQATQEAMVAEMLDFLLAQASGEQWIEASVQDCMDRHHSYADIQIDNFEQSLTMLVETLASAAGDAWRPEYAAAWHDQVRAVVTHVR